MSSSQRLTRKEIKHDIQQDEFVATVGRGVDYAAHHTKTILLAVGAVAVAGALAFGARAWLQARAADANAALAEAVRVAEAPIDAAAPKPNDPRTPSFASEGERRQRAKALLEQVKQEHPRTEAAAVADLYLAGIALEEGDAGTARQLWQAYVAQHDEGMLAAAARMSLLRLDREQGRAEQVAEELRGMLDDAARPLPEDVVLFELAQTLAQLGKAEEAKPLYQRLVDEFPRSPYRSAAEREIGPSGDPRIAGL
ncbi:MAG TPA: tetratricopeptide repeat protein [Thermoanaerobaculia bacterium]|nr:tetratricopeptide repeat protein [Thermoanaerobaculia bacterium]